MKDQLLKLSSLALLGVLMTACGGSSNNNDDEGSEIVDGGGVLAHEKPLRVLFLDQIVDFAE